MVHGAVFTCLDKYGRCGLLAHQGPPRACRTEWNERMHAPRSRIRGSCAASKAVSHPRQRHERLGPLTNAARIGLHEQRALEPNYFIFIYTGHYDHIFSHYAFILRISPVPAAGLRIAKADAHHAPD